MKRKGFTLTEILVVIGIIAVLAAISAPVMIRAKGRAKLTESSSNVRQMLTAIQIYASDFDDVFPFGLPRFWADKRGGLPPDLMANGYSAPFLEDVLLGYGCTEAIYRSPADPGMALNPPVYSRYGTSYSFRIRAFLEPKSMTSYTNPSGYPLIHEADWFHVSPGPDAKRVVGYVDGHVRFAPWREVAPLMDERPTLAD